MAAHLLEIYTVNLNKIVAGSSKITQMRTFHVQLRAKSLIDKLKKFEQVSLVNTHCDILRTKLCPRFFSNVRKLPRNVLHK